MTDNLKNRGPADRSKVNVHEDWEVRWWCNKWNVTKGPAGRSGEGRGDQRTSSCEVSGQAGVRSSCVCGEADRVPVRIGRVSRLLQ